MIRSMIRSTINNEQWYKSMRAGNVAGDYELIESYILGSSQASVVFSNLGDYSSTYKHLQVRMVARSAKADTFDALRFRFNADTGNNYARHFLWGNGSGVESAGAASNNRGYLGFVDGNNATSSVYSPTIIDILDPYSTTKNKTVRALSGIRNQTQTYVGLFSSLWMNTGSVTSLLLETDSVANFMAGSRFSLYGIKG